MSLSIAEQLYKTIISKEHCKGCSEYSHENVNSKYGIIGIPFCKTRWFGETCRKNNPEHE